ncbi:MAG: hypothetical protein AAF790_09705, partial [Planctomycetota bacterium]
MQSETENAGGDDAAVTAAARHDYRFLRGLAIASLVLSAAAAFTLNLVDPDLWGHVAYGRELLAEGVLPRTATHTFTAEGYRWINHENIAEVVFAAGFDWLGVRGMLIAKCLLGVAILLTMYGVARRQGVRSLTVWVLLLLVATNLRAFFPMRPQLLSFACCTLMLLLLDRAFRDWRAVSVGGAPDGCRVHWRWLAAAPALMVLWVNSHGGFVAGLCILGALLAGRAVEAIALERHRSLGVVAGLTAAGVAALLATLVNPYGADLVRWLAESLGSPRPEITEWAAPKLKDPVFWPFVTLAAVNAAAWAFTSRRRDWPQLAILVLVGWQSCMHLRHIAFFALLSGFWTPPHLQSVLARLRARAAEGLPVARISPVMKWGATAVLGLAMCVQAADLADRLTKLPVSRKMYPVDAFDFLSLHGINGRMVVSFNWAQYALAAFPESRVSFDGRFRTCYPQEVVDMNFDFLLGEHRGRRHRSDASGPIDGTRVLEYGDPELVLVDRNYPHAVRVMQAEAQKPDGRWTLLYQDAVAQVWGVK